MTQLLERALEIAIDAHRKQTDRAGRPYILHVLWVGSRGRCDEEAIVGLLHDVVEDSAWTLEDLGHEGFGERVIEALRLITKQEGEDYEDYLERVAANPLARRVKSYDLEHNLDRSRIPKPSERDHERWEKYERALARLRAVEESGPRP